MRVRCIKIISPGGQLAGTGTYGVEFDEEYDVLAILVEPGRGAKLRIVTSDGTPALFDAGMFFSIDTRMPPSWRARVREGGLVEFAPDPWLADGYWEQYFDQEPAAVAEFNRELQVLSEFD